MESALVRDAGPSTGVFQQGVCSVEEVAPREEPGSSRKPISLHCDSACCHPCWRDVLCPHDCAFHQLFHHDWDLPEPSPDQCQGSAGNPQGVRSHRGFQERETWGTAVPGAQSRYPGCRGGWGEKAKLKLSQFLESCLVRVSPSARRVLLWEERSFRSFQSCECSFRERKSLRLIRT